jgi:hypothetical protein
MTRETDLLALRKQVLVARSAMLRLQLEHDAAMMRESLRLPRLASAATGSPRAISALLALATLVAGRRRIGRWIGLAAALFGAVRTLAAIWGSRRRSSGGEESERSG